MTDKVHYHRAVCIVPLSKRVATDDGRGWKTVPAGTRRGEVLLEINLSAITRHLGPKALLNKGRRARGLGGLVKLTASNVKDAPND